MTPQQKKTQLLAKCHQLLDEAAARPDGLSVLKKAEPFLSALLLYPVRRPRRSSPLRGVPGLLKVVDIKAKHDQRR